jgi:hypothetical protein
MTDKPKITADLLLDEVKKLAAEYPDFVYIKVDEPTEEGYIGCSNLDGGDPKYPHLKGCIVGQAYHRLAGCPVPKDCSHDGVTSLVERVIGPDEDPGTILTLSLIQDKQDEMRPWSEAVKAACNL